jgi:nucleotide-binding universal stress UspA family protein
VRTQSAARRQQKGAGVLTFRAILCPLDFSESSDKALRNAAEIASHFQAELLLVHVLAPTPVLLTEPAYVLGDAPVMPATSIDVYEQRRQQEADATDRLNLSIQQLPSQVKSRTKIGLGDAAEEIVRIASTEKVDLIVIATHGVTGWRHLVFGSVAEKVIRLATQPVLVIPAHDLDEGAE